MFQVICAICQIVTRYVIALSVKNTLKRIYRQCLKGICVDFYSDHPDRHHKILYTYWDSQYTTCTTF